MILEDISRALYALPSGVVVERRQPVYRPMLIAVVGAVLLVVNFLLVDDKSGAMGMSLMVAGIAMLLYGVIVAITRLTSDKREPYHTPTKRYMHTKERYYDREYLVALQKAVARGDSAGIEALPAGNVAAITLVECYSHDRSIVAYAIYEYVNFDYMLIGEVKLIVRG